MNDCWHKRKVDHFDPNNVLLAIARNIPVLLKTGFVLQGHIYTRSFSFVKLVNISLENLWKLTIYKSHGKYFYKCIIFIRKCSLYFLVF